MYCKILTFFCNKAGCCCCCCCCCKCIHLVNFTGISIKTIGIGIKTYKGIKFINQGTLVFKFSRGSSPFLSAEGAGLLPPLHKAADSAPATLQFPPATFFQFENPGYQTVFSSFESNKAGVCILFNNNFNLQIQKLFIDPFGRFIIRDINANEESLTLANIYAPNDDNQVSF